MSKDDVDSGNEDKVEINPNTGKPIERRKIEIKFIQNKTKRHVTFSKRKHGIMKKAYELSVLTGTQVLLLVVSETGLVYTFTTPKFQPIVTQPEGKNLIQACLNAPDDEDEEEEDDEDEDEDEEEEEEEEEGEGEGEEEEEEEEENEVVEEEEYGEAAPQGEEDDEEEQQQHSGRVSKKRKVSGQVSSNHNSRTSSTGSTGSSSGTSSGGMPPRAGSFQQGAGQVSQNASTITASGNATSGSKHSISAGVNSSDQGNIYAQHLGASVHH